MDKILKSLWILQEKPNPDAFRRFRKVKRLNPYNPLTYIMLVIIYIIGFIMFGIVGFWSEIETKGLFKYQ